MFLSSIDAFLQALLLLVLAGSLLGSARGVLGGDAPPDPMPTATPRPADWPRRNTTQLFDPSDMTPPRRLGPISLLFFALLGFGGASVGYAAWAGMLPSLEELRQMVAGSVCTTTGFTGPLIGPF